MEFSRKRTCLQCSLCEEAFADVASLESHLTSHHRCDVMPLKRKKKKLCLGCDEPDATHGAAVSLGASPKHRRRDFTCCQVICYKYIACAQSFSHLGELTKHMATHSSSKLIYVCSSCDAEFLSISQLKEHVGAHCRDVWWKKVEIRGVQQVQGEAFSDDTKVIEEIKTEEEDWIDREEFSCCGSVGEAESVVVAAADGSGCTGEQPGDATLHSPEGAGDPETIHNDRIQEDCEQVQIHSNLVMYPDSNGDIRYEFVSNESVEVLEESARNLNFEQKDVPCIVMYLDPSGNVKHQNVTEESVRRLQKKAGGSSAGPISRKEVVFYLSGSGNVKFLNVTCKSFRMLQKKSLNAGLLLEPSENVLMYLDPDGNLGYLNVLNESVETVRRVSSSIWMQEVLVPDLVLFFNEGCGIQYQEVFHDYLKPLFKVNDCVRGPQGPNDNVVMYLGANGRVRCLQVSRDVMKMLNQNYISEHSSRSSGFSNYVRQIADGRGLQRSINSRLVPKLQLNDVRKYLDAEGRLSKEQYRQLKCDLKNEQRKLKRPKKPTVPCELFLGMEISKCDVREQNCTCDEIHAARVLGSEGGKDLSGKERCAKKATSDETTAKEMTRDARAKTITCGKECTKESSSDQTTRKELTIDEITAKYLRRDMKRAKRIIKERMRAQKNANDSPSAPQDTPQTTVNVIKPFNKKTSNTGHRKGIGGVSFVPELIDISSQGDPTDVAKEQVTSNSKRQVEEEETAQIGNAKEPRKTSGNEEDTDVIVPPNAQERSNVVLLKGVRNVSMNRENQGNIIMVQNADNQLVLQDRSNLLFVPNGNNKLVLPDRSNVILVPNSSNQKTPSDKSNLVLVPNLNNQGMVPNGSNLVLVPNLNNQGMVPGGSNLVLVPNLNNQGMVPDRANLVFMPNVSNQTMQPNNLVLVANAAHQIVQQDEVNALANEKHRRILPQIPPDKSNRIMLQSTQDNSVLSDRNNVRVDIMEVNVREDTDGVSVVLRTNNGVVQPKSDTTAKQASCDKTRVIQKPTLKMTNQQEAMVLSPEMPMPMPTVKDVAARLEVQSCQKTLSPNLRCSLCGRSFQSISELKLHMKSHPGRSVVFRCNVCGFGYLEIDDLLLHISVHAQGKTTSDLQVFQQTNSQQRLMSGRMQYRCRTCAEAFSEVLALVNHKSTHKEGAGSRDEERKGLSSDNDNADKGGPLVCVPEAAAAVPSSEDVQKEGCELSPATATDIEITFEEMGSASFKCAICNRMFYLLSELEEHLKMHNDQKLVYKCTLCSSCFQDLLDFKKHLSMHTVEDMKTSLLKKPPPLSLLVPWRKNSVVQSSSVATTPPAGDKLFPPPDFHETAVRQEKYRPRYECCVCDDAFKIVLKHLKHDKFHSKMLEDVHCGGMGNEAKKTITHSESSENEVHGIDRSTTLKEDAGALKNRMRYECLVCDSVFETLAAWGHEQLHDNILCYALYTPSLSTMIAYLMPHLDHEYTSNQTSNQEPTPALKAQLEKIQIDLKNYTSSLPATLSVTKKLLSDIPQKPPQSPPKEKASAAEGGGSPSTSLCIKRGQQEKEKPDNTTYLCENCGKSCSYKGLKRHRLLHSESAPIACPLCSRMFKTVVSLVGHVATHTGMDPRVCKVCRTGFVKEEHWRGHCENGGCKRSAIRNVEGKAKGWKEIGLGDRPTIEQRDSTAVDAASEITEEEAEQEEREHPVALLQTDKEMMLVPREKMKEQLPTVNYRNFSKYTCNVCREVLPNVNVLKLHMMQRHCDNVDLRCDPCKLTFKSKKKLLSHQKIHSVNTPFKCTNCSKAFPTIRALKSHIDDHNRESGNYVYECSICKQQLADLQELARHKELHVNVESGCLFECNICNIQLEELADLEGHKDIHAGLNEVCVFECNICSEKMMEFVDLETHRAIHSCENSIYAFQCNVCEEHFMDPCDLEAHREVHVDINEPCACECNICEEQFTSIKELEEHVLEAHAKKVHLCDICGKVFHNVLALKGHKRSHLPVSFPCETCGKSFQKRAALKQHMYTHSEKMFLCDFCPRTFARSSRLKAHRLSHTREAVIKCDKCDKEFTDRKMFRYHMLRHEGRRPYECDICLKKFYSSSSAVVHRRVHFPERPFKCTVCKKSFREKYFLQCHIRKHGLPPYKCDICGTGFAYKNHLDQHKYSH